MLRPNIIVLGVGHSNTTLTVRQISTLGWSLPDPDDKWLEHPHVRLISDAWAANMSAPHDASQVIASLKQPWVLKDPRFVLTLDDWRPVLAAYNPLLLWVTKDRQQVRRSYLKRGEDKYTESHHWRLAGLQFAKWPGPKLRLQAEAIARACAMLDKRKMSYCLD